MDKRHHVILLYTLTVRSPIRCYTIEMKSVARLYTQFQPRQYDLKLTIDEEANCFSGTVVIYGRKVGRPSKRVTLHQHSLSIKHAHIVKLDKKTEREIEVTRINNQKSLQEVRIHSNEMIYPGEYILTVHFEAPLTTNMTGIYPCFFKDGDTDKQLIMTQFESHHAREAFPCIDEPEAKAIFNLTLNTRTDVSVLANTPIKEQRTDADRLISVFETTPKMSSYLLAFIFGEMISKSKKTANGVTVNVWATVAQPSDALDFSLDIATRSIEFFEDYFGVPYPLAKADHVACPDFSSGAMENWGLITYRERLLVAYPEETAQSTYEQIALVIAHETSHQWFGNLVTMRWWDDLWLNESFADLMEFQAVDALEPDWNVWNTFISGDGLSALRRDAVTGVQAVRTEVHHPDEISSLFDPSIVYAKGGRLLYMLKNYIGEEAFRSGLKKYFENHAYGNTEGADLWAELSAASGKDIASFMTPWLTRSGFPLVSVSQDGETVTLSQEQFQDDPTKADKERLWPIPTFSNIPSLPDQFEDRTHTVGLHDNSLVLLDTDARGHYIVRYTNEDRMNTIIKKIQNKELSEPDRLMLLNGSSMVAKAGYEPYGSVLKMLDAYRQEVSEPVWDIMALVIGETRRFIDTDETLEAKIKPFVDALSATQVERLGWDAIADESFDDTKLRALVLGLSAYAENVNSVQRATELFESYKKDSSTVSAEIRPLVFVVPVKNGDDSAFSYLLDLHDTTPNGDLKLDASSALTATRDPKKAAQLLARLTDATIVKPQDVDRWLVWLLRNRYVRDIAWDWMVDSWQWLEDTFSNDKSYDYLPRYAASCVNTREYEKKFHDLFEDKQDQVLLKRNIQLGFAEIETRLNWIERDRSSVQDFFST